MINSNDVYREMMLTYYRKARVKMLHVKTQKGINKKPDIKTILYKNIFYK